MNIHFPQAKALCIADNVARSMHNILTPRGALVRDPRIWAHYLDQAIELFGTETDVLFSGHNWPCWGGEQIVDYLEKQRDLYTYLHDQTLRLLNKGHTGPEIAELIELPPTAPPDIVANLSVEQLLDAMAIRLDGPRAWECQLRIDWVIADPDEMHALTVRNGVLRHRSGRHEPSADASLQVDRKALDQLLLKTADIAELAESGRLRVEGDGEKIGELLGLLDEPDPGFAIVTPD